MTKKDVKKIECEEAIRMLLEYLDNELDEHNHDSVEDHLHACRACYTRMEFESRLKNVVKEKAQEKAPIDLRNRIKKISEQF
ncbi:MAG: zf-HC2 domain-containing protein [Gammaproteobacteria bacterium]|nr:zf-HC2 domain-containing protein [Gammaproteobacteria bacterium]